MSVRVRHRANVAMMEEFLREFQPPRSLLYDASRRVTKRVQTRSAFRPRNAQTVQRRIKDIPTKDIRSVRLGEYEVVRTAVLRHSAMLQEHLFQHGVKPNQISTAFRLRWDDLLIPEALFNPQLTLIERNVLPLQTEQFTWRDRYDNPVTRALDKGGHSV